MILIDLIGVALWLMLGCIMGYLHDGSKPVFMCFVLAGPLGVPFYLIAARLKRKTR